MRLSRFPFLLLLLFVFLASVAAYKLFQPDQKKFQKLLKKTAVYTHQLHGVPLPVGFDQVRLEEQKDIWVTRAGGRLQARLLSDASNLVILEHQGESQIFEKMRGVKGFFQEAIYYRLPTGEELYATQDKWMDKKSKKIWEELA